MSINFGLIGPGSIAERKLAPAINATEGANLWSVASRSEERAKEFVNRHGTRGEQSAFDDYDEMLADPDLDAVMVAVPDRLHAETGIRALRAGKHVLMEKPMVASSKEGKKLLKERDKSERKLGVAYHLRWQRGHRKTIRKIHDGALGKLHHARLQWSFKTADDSNWRADDELGRWWGLAGVGTHGLDLIRWAMTPVCGEVIEVESIIANDYWGSPHDETAMVNMKFESGATAELTTSVLFESERVFKVYGNEGGSICRDTLGSGEGGSITFLGEELTFPRINPYEGEIKDFVGAIENDREPEVAGEEGLRNVEILEEAAPEDQAKI